MQRFLCSKLFTRQYLERQSTIAKQIAKQIKTELKRRLTPMRIKVILLIKQLLWFTIWKWESNFSKSLNTIIDDAEFRETEILYFFNITLHGQSWDHRGLEEEPLLLDHHCESQCSFRWEPLYLNPLLQLLPVLYPTKARYQEWCTLLCAPC